MQKSASPQLIKALQELRENRVTPEDFGMSESGIMEAPNGKSWSVEKEEGTFVKLVKNSDDSFNVETHRE